MRNIRKQIFPLGQYLKDMKDEKVRADQECQRRSGQWTQSMINELIASVLSDDYIYPIVLGETSENGITLEWIVDGLQRSSSLFMFRYGNTRISQKLDEHMITYQRKATDENGNVKRDRQGEIIWENVDFDIRNKTYEQLPEELKEIFNSYQLDTVIHQKCDKADISRLVRKLNNCKSMNQAQRAFTYVDTFATDIRKIADNRFFKDVYSGSAKDRINGNVERIIGNMVILCEYPDQYRKDTKESFKWLNENAVLLDFENLNKLLTRLTESINITSEIRGLFNKKNAHIFVPVFKAFTELGRADKDFEEFLRWFITDGKNTEINEKTWVELDVDRSTTNNRTVHRKLDYLIELINLYFEKNRKSA